MRVFVTGATGLVGTATVRQLLLEGHDVTGLARSDKSADLLKQLGVTSILRGDVTTLDVLQEGARNADAVVHAAFNHDAFKSGAFVLASIQAMCEVLRDTSPPGQPKTFIYTSGLLGNAGPDETSGKIPNEHHPRHLSEELTLSYAARGVRSIVVRLSPIVHGPGYEHPFVALQAPVARKHGFVAYVGDGQQQWASVHVDDAATLICLALTKSPSGSNLHCLAEELYVKDIVERIAKYIDLPTKSIEAKDAAAHYQSFIGMIMQSSMHSTSELTREWTGWQPKGYNLFKEMENYKFSDEA
ncbi:hypothetical protein EMMF5_001422 [Cystobasidiomycetes sp. EMM_F5]